MVSPISMNSPKVYFRGEGVDINAPGKYSAAPADTESDKLDLSEEAKANKPKKGGVLKTIGKVIGGAIVLAAASFGLFKWKGDKWLAPEAKGFLANAKKWLVKPGEWLNKGVYEPLANMVARGRGEKVEEIVEEVVDDIGEAAAKS